MSLKKPIQIFARLKPTSDQFPYEIEKIESDGTNDEILVFNMKAFQPAEEYNSLYYAQRPQENQRFRYSKVFDSEAQQEEIFQKICRPVIDSALAGYNGTIFAYGQTGSGKTFTMTGSRDDFRQRGIIPRTLSYIFQKFQEREEQMEMQAMFISYLEIYNEAGYDLLHPSMATGKLEDLKKVVLMEDAQQQIHLRHLSVNPVEDESQAMHLFYMGEHHRTIAETPMNEASTRSHCIFTVHLHARGSDEAITRKAKLHLVDLAGSERIANSNPTGQLFNEARHINLALHYLEQVIVALGEAHRTHIPYRNSMMTSILRDSLGGNCMTSMIATLSLEPRNIPETLSTCRFSQRVALVTNDATLNEEVDPELVIAQLKAEIKRLQSQLENPTLRISTLQSEPITQDEFSHCCQAVQSFLTDENENAVLEISPDMRLIQQCFLCLRYACHELKKDFESVDKNCPPQLTEGDPISDDTKIAYLSRIVEAREREIKVLTQMLEKHKRVLQEHNLYNPPLSASASMSGRETASAKNGEPSGVSPGGKRTESNSPKATLDPLKAQFERFLQSNGGKKELNDTKKELHQLRTELEKVKDEIEKERNELNALKLPEKTTDSNQKQCERHEEELVKKERLFFQLSEQINRHESIVQGMQAKLMQEFETSLRADKDKWREGDDANNDMSLANAAAGVFKRLSTEGQSTSNVETQPSPSNSTLKKSGRKPGQKSDRRKRREKSPRGSGRSQNGDKEEHSIQSLLCDQFINITNPKKKSKSKKNKGLATEQTGDPPKKTDEASVKNDANDEQDIIQACPMTGDPTCDREILTFLKKRQAVFKRINEEKQGGQGRSLSSLTSVIKPEVVTTPCETSS